jgi:hypothetical protein
LDKQIELSKKYLQQAYSIKKEGVSELLLHMPVLNVNKEFKLIINSLK